MIIQLNNLFDILGSTNIYIISTIFNLNKNLPLLFTAFACNRFFFQTDFYISKK